jgi:predicted phosphodiesterase
LPLNDDSATEARETPRPEGRRRFRVILFPPTAAHQPLLVALTLAISLAVGLAAFALLAHTTFDLGPTRVTIAAVPAFAGSTTLALPPFGSVSAATHFSPIAVKATLQEVDPARLQGFALSSLTESRTIDALRAQATGGALRALAKGLAAALVCAAFVAWALRRSWRTTLAAAALGLVVPALMVGAAVLGFNAGAFRDPRYEGAMQYAPSLISLVQSRVAHVGDLQAQIGETVRELSAYYAKPESFSAGGAMPNTFRVLQVSDLHMDPIGFQLEADLAKEFDASVILDLGDASTYGTPIEASLLQRFLDPRLPRIFVPGNHESPQVVRSIAALPNVSVLESSSVTVDGLTVYGLADPMSRSMAWKPDMTAMARESAAAAAKVRAAEAAGGRKPEIIAVHNPDELGPFAGLAPLLVAGHTHTPALGHIGTSWYLNAGTVGGVAYLKVIEDPSLPHGAAILYYTQALPRRLVAIDQISVWGRTGQKTSLKRTVVDEKLLAELSAKK